MSEMLGNYFFLNHNYQSACDELENALKDDPSNNAIQRKLILCYIKLGAVIEGYYLFRKLVKTNIECIVHCYFKENPCPCLEIINELNDSNSDTINEKYKNLSLGILWLYCDIDRSLYYLNKAKINLNTDKKLTEIVNSICIYAKKIKNNNEK